MDRKENAALEMQQIIEFCEDLCVLFLADGVWRVWDCKIN